LLIFCTCRSPVKRDRHRSTQKIFVALLTNDSTVVYQKSLRPARGKCAGTSCGADMRLWVVSILKVCVSSTISRIRLRDRWVFVAVTSLLSKTTTIPQNCAFPDMNVTWTLKIGIRIAGTISTPDVFLDIAILSLFAKVGHFPTTVSATSMMPQLLRRVACVTLKIGPHRCAMILNT
jgi:hypothetical protein